ncbi:hypothetical protein [uncultured Flavobacterium sp.]|uniref:hypothetical protein n=1 Tax=uncultured Flavobacterium sp. TaxID=165435 RepID=UPI0025E97229|nr:hypothetical protein [uncultured Flavobacterium sp.]
MLFFFAIACTSCGTSVLLKNGYTKVPKDNCFFDNPRFDERVFTIIDTSSIYIEAHTFYRGTKFPVERYVSVLRFYPNGLYNEFTFEKSSIILSDLGNNSLDFTENGNRGYYYFEKGKLQLVSYGASNELYTMGANESEIVLTPENLLKETPRKEKISHYYEKNPVPQKWKNVVPDHHWK